MFTRTIGLNTRSARIRYWIVAMLALAGVAVASVKLLQSTEGLIVEHLNSGPIPISVFRKQGEPPGPLVVVAHGFAGSRPMMQQFAVSLAQNGYLAATFDFSGHGRNRVPLTGDLQSIDGATQVLVKDIGRVVDAVKSRYVFASDELAVVGHSMASDLVVRYAQMDDHVAATVGVAMFSPAVSANSPRNLLVINGEWENRLNSAGYEVLAQVAGSKEIKTDETYGDFKTGTARRMVLVDNTEHIAVLFSRESAQASVNWLNQVFKGSVNIKNQPQPRGQWILLLIAGIVALWWALTPYLPVVTNSSVSGRATRKQTALVLIVPMLITPLVLSLFTISFLPVLVGDYLAVHMAIYGVSTALLTLCFQPRIQLQRAIYQSENVEHIPIAKIFFWRRFFTAVFLLLLLSLPLAITVHWQVASFLPTVERIPLLMSIAVGTLCWCMADEWATRRTLQWRWCYPVSKLAFLVSLAIAVALDFEGLFFLLLIVPIMVPVLIVFGLLSRWTYRSTGCALIAGVCNALVLAWAIAATFPWVGKGV